MTQEPRLTAKGRAKVRRLVLYEISYNHLGAGLTKCIQWTYRDWPNHQAYAFAMLAALEGDQPLDISAGRRT